MTTTQRLREALEDRETHDKTHLCAAMGITYAELTQAVKTLREQGEVISEPGWGRMLKHTAGTHSPHRTRDRD